MRHLLLLPALTCLLSAQTVTGRVLGQDGKPMKLAHARILGGATATADTSGNFTLQAPNQGPFRLALGGVNHHELVLSFLATPKDLKVEARLRTYEMKKDLSKLAVLTLVNGRPSGSTPLVRQGDGIYLATVRGEGSTFSYEVGGAELGGRTINGTQAASYIYDGDGDYMAQVPLVSGKAEIRFDPSRFGTSGEATFAFGPGNEEAQAVAEVFAASDSAPRLFYRAMVGQKPGTKMERPKEITGWTEGWAQRLTEEKRPSVRAALLAGILQFAPNRLPQGWEKDLPPSSPIFKLQPGLVPQALENLGEGPARQAYMAAFLDAADPQPVLGWVKGPLMFGEADKAAMRLKALEALRPDHPALKKLRSELEAAQRMAVGQPAPAFELADLDQPGKTVSPTAFSGKYVLLDFWATWCGPCRAEMPALHQAYQRFKGRGLEILSLSFDQKEGDIAPFRKDAAHPMPWRHAFVPMGFASPLAQAYAVRGIPKPILLGPDGKILAIGGDLRGENLEATLERCMGAPKAGGQ